MVGRWWSSNGSVLSKCNFVLHRRSPLPHERILFSHKMRCAQASSALLCFAANRISCCILSIESFWACSFALPNFGVHRVMCPARRHNLAALQSQVFPRLNLHRARVYRKRRRLPSCRCIESAQAYPARACISFTRASDTALGLPGTCEPSTIAMVHIELPYAP
jgi:hypothetical protein